MKKFTSVVQDDTAIPQYIHQCNVQTPAGEAAFWHLMAGFGWAKNPMIKRIHEIRHDVPITLLYGSRSWVDSASSEVIQKARPNSYVQSHVINQAGHHVYADKPEEFNKLIVEACRLIENNENDKGESNEEESNEK